jgi:hypothetical protein
MSFLLNKSPKLYSGSGLDLMEFVSGPARYKATAEYDLGCGDTPMPYLISRHYDNLRVFEVSTQ